MRKIIKKFVKDSVIGVARILAKTRFGRYAIDQLLNSAMSSHQIVRHGWVELSFVVPNSLNLFRANTFSSKEPETLEWIDQRFLNPMLDLETPTIKSGIDPNLCV